MERGGTFSTAMEIFISHAPGHMFISDKNNGDLQAISRF